MHPVTFTHRHPPEPACGCSECHVVTTPLPTPVQSPPPPRRVLRPPPPSVWETWRWATGARHSGIRCPGWEKHSTAPPAGGAMSVREASACRARSGWTDGRAHSGCPTASPRGPDWQTSIPLPWRRSLLAAFPARRLAVSDREPWSVSGLIPGKRDYVDVSAISCVQTRYCIIQSKPPVNRQCPPPAVLR